METILSKKRVILIDYENMQQIDLDLIDPANSEILIFVGKSQNKIPFTVVEKAQSLGERLRWLKVAGDGKNNLDFHIAYELGRWSEKAKSEAAELIVLSRDAGYDSLIQYIKTTGVKAKRITNIAGIANSQKPLPSSPHTASIVANLKKINASQRPRARGSLKKHVESLLRDKASAKDIELVMEEMFNRGLIAQSGSRLRYTLESYQ
jgi:hypothetical protein